MAGGIPSSDAQSPAPEPVPGPGPITPEFEPTGAQSLIVDPSPQAAPAPAEADEPDPWIGRSIANFEIVQKLGQGGMGVVYKGRQRSLDRTVAIKILGKALSENQEFIKRFEREAKSIARISHPNIVAVYDFGTFEGTWYMVSEFVEGTSLAGMIAERVLLTLEEMGPIMTQCLGALAHVGAMGVVHRDIKPDNILITRDGTAKLLDFGLAKDVSGSNDSTDLTGTGLAMGTPAYMSPEQCMGRKLDGRSDLYALGVTAYYALTGEKPFTGQSSFEIMTRQREHVPAPPSHLNPRIPARVSDLVMRMLAKNPLDRYPDAEACRLAWAEAIGAPLRSSGLHAVPRETVAPASSRTSGRQTPLPLPELPQVSNPTPPSLQAPPSLTATGIPVPPLTTPRPTRGGGSEGVRRPPSEISDPPSGRIARVGTEARRVRPEAATCPRCGHLNRPEATACGKCGTALRSEAPGRDAQAEAERLLDAGQHKEAAALFARLADAEQDRRLRSVLRSKERDARLRDLERQEQDLAARAAASANAGDLKGALATLEAGRSQLTKDVTASMAGTALSATERLMLELRARLARRRQLRAILVLALVAAVAAAVVALVLLKGRP
jgi:serine/threonine protein kinase